jgi:hypothetical protein
VESVREHEGGATQWMPTAIEGACAEKERPALGGGEPANELWWGTGHVGMAVGWGTGLPCKAVGGAPVGWVGSTTRAGWVAPSARVGRAGP